MPLPCYSQAPQGCDRAGKPCEGTRSFSGWWQGQTLTARIDHFRAPERELVPSAPSKENTLLPNPCSTSAPSNPDCQPHRCSSDPHETRVHLGAVPKKQRKGRPRQGVPPSTEHPKEQPRPQLFQSQLKLILLRAGSQKKRTHKHVPKLRDVHCQQGKGSERTQTDPTQLRALWHPFPASPAAPAAGDAAFQGVQILLGSQRSNIL